MIVYARYHIDYAMRSSKDGHPAFSRATTFQRCAVEEGTHSSSTWPDFLHKLQESEWTAILGGSTETVFVQS
jgi:hypothetical protein